MSNSIQSHFNDDDKPVNNTIKPPPKYRQEDCPVLNAYCKHYFYQHDSNGQVAICYCSHPNNINNYEGNCIHMLCPRAVNETGE